tara:strand:+ start:295 stop:624 length:330 start_codon:yes stop_codon:yes gene_type:complete
MSLLAMCMPILAGKKEAWLAAIQQINSPDAKPDADAIRENAGVHERAFLQETPDGDFVILTYEGENPVESFGKIMENLPPDFAEFVMDIHGMDVNSPPPLPTLVYDSRS